MSNKINDGGPAFPQAFAMAPKLDQGMSLRDHFAGLAMQAVMTCSGPTWRDNGYKPIDGLSIMQNNARLSYDMADEMIKARSA